MAYDPFDPNASAVPTATPLAANNALAPAVAPSGNGSNLPRPNMPPVNGNFGGGFRNAYGGFGGFMGPGMFNRMGGFLNGLQLPADMTANDLLGKLQGLDWRSLMQGYRSDMQDYRQNGGQRPTFQSEFADYLGGTYGSPAPVTADGNTGIVPPAMGGSPVPPVTLPTGDGSPVMTPGGGGTGAPLQGGNVGMVPGIPGSMGLNPMANLPNFRTPPRFGRTGG